MDVHTICLIGGTTLYCVLAFYLLWNILFLSSSSCFNRSCDSYPLRRPSRSGRRGVLPEITTIGIKVYRLFSNTHQCPPPLQTKPQILFNHNGNLEITITKPKRDLLVGKRTINLAKFTEKNCNLKKPKPR